MAMAEKRLLEANEAQAIEVGRREAAANATLDERSQEFAREQAGLMRKYVRWKTEEGRAAQQQARPLRLA